MNLKKLAAYCGTAIAGFVVGKKITDARWEYALIKFQTELEDDAKRRREEYRHRHPNYQSYFNRKYRQNNEVNDGLCFDTNEDAFEVVKKMDEMIQKYGSVSVVDLYDLIGACSRYSDVTRGWYDITDAEVYKTRHGYVVELPNPVDLTSKEE